DVVAAAGNARLPERQQNLAVRTELEHLSAHLLTFERTFGRNRRVAERGLASVGIARPDVSLGVDGEPVREREHAAAKAFQQLARLVELQDRRLGAADSRRRALGLRVETAVIDPDVPFRIGVDTKELAPGASGQE